MLLILMLQDNDIVIIDEPFNGIDLAGTIVLRQWLKEMKATRCEVSPCEGKDVSYEKIA